MQVNKFWRVRGGSERYVFELSRMLSGLPETDAAATHAEELLAEAGKTKRPTGG